MSRIIRLAVVAGVLATVAACGQNEPAAAPEPVSTEPAFTGKLG